MKRLVTTILLAVSMLFALASPAAAGPEYCYYEYNGKRICVSENGVEIPEGTMWFCVIYTFSGGQICVSSDGRIAEYP